MRNLIILSTFALAFSGYATDSCAEYVEYLCDCSSDEDCEEYRNTFEDADQDAQDECAANLDKAQAASESCGDSGSST